MFLWRLPYRKWKLWNACKEIYNNTCQWHVRIKLHNRANEKHSWVTYYAIRRLIKYSWDWNDLCVNLANARELVYARLYLITSSFRGTLIFHNKSYSIGNAFSSPRSIRESFDDRFRQVPINLPPTNIYFFAGEYILSSGSQNGSGSSIIEEDGPLLNEASLALDNHPLADLTDDSLGLNDTLGLEHDFTSELLGSSLLENAGVEGLLSNDTLGLPDEFNLEEALQLVGLDEAQPEVCEISSYLLLKKATIICIRKKSAILIVCLFLSSK